MPRQGFEAILDRQSSQALLSTTDEVPNKVLPSYYHYMAYLHHEDVNALSSILDLPTSATSRASVR